MDSKTIIRCPNCGQQLRIPSDKVVMVTCQKCRSKFKANENINQKKTFVDQLYDEHPPLTILEVNLVDVMVGCVKDLLRSRFGSHYFKGYYTEFYSTDSDIGFENYFVDYSEASKYRWDPYKVFSDPYKIENGLNYYYGHDNCRYYVNWLTFEKDLERILINDIGFKTCKVTTEHKTHILKKQTRASMQVGTITKVLGYAVLLEGTW